MRQGVLPWHCTTPSSAPVALLRHSQALLPPADPAAVFKRTGGWRWFPASSSTPLGTNDARGKACTPHPGWFTEEGCHGRSGSGAAVRFSQTAAMDARALLPAITSSAIFPVSSPLNPLTTPPLSPWTFCPAITTLRERVACVYPLQIGITEWYLPYIWISGRFPSRLLASLPSRLVLYQHFWKPINSI